jgi:hypothetical protein
MNGEYTVVLVSVLFGRVSPPIHLGKLTLHYPCNDKTLHWIYGISPTCATT